MEPGADFQQAADTTVESRKQPLQKQKKIQWGRIYTFDIWFTRRQASNSRSEARGQKAESSQGKSRKLKAESRNRNWFLVLGWEFLLSAFPFLFSAFQINRMGGLAQEWLDDKLRTTGQITAKMQGPSAGARPSNVGSHNECPAPGVASTLAMASSNAVRRRGSFSTHSSAVSRRPSFSTKAVHDSRARRRSSSGVSFSNSASISAKLISGSF